MTCNLLEKIKINFILCVEWCTSQIFSSRIVTPTEVEESTIEAMLKFRPKWRNLTFKDN